MNDMQKLKIIPLSHDNIAEAIKLASLVFTHDTEGKHSPSNVFWSIIEPEKYREYRKKRKVLECFLAINSMGKIVGVTGFYRRNWEKKGIVWLGWFYVDKTERGKGYGKYLLEWTINKVKQKGFKVFKLWTTTDPNEAVAQNLYEKVGLKIIGKGRRPGVEHIVMYRAKQL